MTNKELKEEFKQNGGYLFQEIRDNIIFRIKEWQNRTNMMSHDKNDISRGHFDATVKEVIDAIRLMNLEDVMFTR